MPLLPWRFQRAYFPPSMPFPNRYTLYYAKNIEFVKMFCLFQAQLGICLGGVREEQWIAVFGNPKF